MDDFLRYQKTLSAVILGIVILGTAALYFFLPAKWWYSMGLFWGGAAGLITFRMKVLAIVRFAQNPQGAPVKSGFQQLMINIVFLGAIIAVNRCWGQPQWGHDIANLWTAFAGIVVPNIVLMADGLLRPAVLAGATGENNAAAATAVSSADNDTDNYRDF